MHDNEHHKPNLDALVSNAAQRRLQPSLTLEEIVSAPLTIAEHITSPAKPPQSSRARKNLIKTRLSDSEYRAFAARVKRSKLSASEFLRRAALTGRIVIPLHTELDVALLDELALLKADVGRIGGLLKMTIRPNRMGRTAARRTAGGAYGKAVGGVGGEDCRWLSSSIAAPKTPAMRMCWSTTPAGIGRTAAPDIMRQFWMNTA